MDNWEELEQFCYDNDVQIIQQKFNSDRIKGLYCNGMVALNKNIATTAERSCILAEELGHHYTTSGNIIDPTSAVNRKQEQIARVWAYCRHFDLDKLILCFRHGCCSVHEAAEYLEITEEFFLDAISYYKQHYGLNTVIGNYMITFEPLGILELYDKES